jgi:protein-disulfide isomerase
MAKKPASGRTTTARQQKVAAAQQASAGPNRVVIGAVVLVVVIAAVVGVVAAMSASNPVTTIITDTPTSSATATSSGSPTASGATPAGTAMGHGYAVYPGVARSAGVPTVDVYEDFQCAGCAQFEGALGETLQTVASAGRVTLVYHVLTALDGTSSAKASTLAAEGAFCAAASGHFVGFHNAVFANQPTAEGTGWTAAQLSGIAQAAGITGTALADWQRCTASGTYAAYVASVQRAATAAHIATIPRVDLNGSPIDLSKANTPQLLVKALADAAR